MFYGCRPYDFIPLVLIQSFENCNGQILIRSAELLDFSRSEVKNQDFSLFADSHRVLTCWSTQPCFHHNSGETHKFNRLALPVFPTHGQYLGSPQGNLKITERGM